MGRESYHHGNLRQALVDATVGLIEDKGPMGFTLAEAARQAGVSAAAPYRHFSGRDQLLEEVARQGFHDFALRLEFRDKVAALSVLLNELPIACRTAFIMNKVEGHSHREIAETLGISVSMVEKHMLRALCHCRDVRREMDHV